MKDGQQLHSIICLELPFQAVPREIEMRHGDMELMRGESES
jgi:hypothetical protein